MTLETARSQMVRQQVRTWDVLDQRVLDVLTEIPRERFAPEEFRDVALADAEIPLEDGQSMSTPKLVGRMLQSLELEPGHRILEIGTGSGYVTACLARLGGHVTSLDIRAGFTEMARRHLGDLEINNVELLTADVFEYRPEEEFDAILFNGSLPEFPPDFQHWLRIGGNLLAVIGQGVIMEALRIRRESASEWSRESLFETRLPPLDNAPRPEPFVF